MPIYKTILRRKEEIADEQWHSIFEKPGGFAFKAGQFGDFTLIDPVETDAEGNTRGFSLASAPYEGDLMFATRMRDTAFKRELKTMEVGRKFRWTLLMAPSPSTTTRESQPSSLQVASELHLSEASCYKLLMTIFLIRSFFSIRTAGRKTLRFWTN